MERVMTEEQIQRMRVRVEHVAIERKLVEDLAAFLGDSCEWSDAAQRMGAALERVMAAQDAAATKFARQGAREEAQRARPRPRPRPRPRTPKAS